MFVLHMLMLT